MYLPRGATFAINIENSRVFYNDPETILLPWLCDSNFWLNSLNNLQIVAIKVAAFNNCEANPEQKLTHLVIRHQPTAQAL